MTDKQRKFVKVDSRDGITWVWLNRPEKRNAMSPALHAEMDATLEELEHDPDTKVVMTWVTRTGSPAPRHDLEVTTGGPGMGGA